MKKVETSKIKKGGTVEVIAGKYKGKTGKVLQLLPQSNRALVEGVNFVKKHKRQGGDTPQGGIIEMEAPIAISNLRVSGKQ